MENIKLYKIDRIAILAMFLLLPILSVVQFSAKYTIISFLFITIFFGYFKFSQFKAIALSYPLVLWLILTLYHWINAMDKGVPEVDILDLFHGLKIYCCIVIFAYYARRNFDQTIKSLVICFSIYILISFVINNRSADFNGRLSGVIFATGLGQTAAISGVYIAYYSLRNKLSLLKTGMLYILPVLAILLTQSRNSLAMLAIIMMGHGIALSAQKGLNMRKVVVALSIITVFAFIVFDFVVENTDLGKRLTDTEAVQESLEVNRMTTGTFFDTVAGDRIVYYVLGWKYLMDVPFTGIGMWNFMYISQGEFPLHSEYMVHLAEGGIIGFFIWSLFIIAVFRGVIKCRQPQYIKIIALFSLIAIMFCGIYARVFYYEFFYPVFGIAIALAGWGIKDKQTV